MADREWNTIVYRYGLLSPVVGAERVEHGFSVAHRYRNQLVELERARREKIRALESAEVRELHARVQAAEQAIEARVAAIKRERARTRKRSEPVEWKRELRALRAQRKEAFAVWREARRSEIAAHKPQLAEIDEWAKAERRRLRPGLSKGPDGVRHGTYQLVEDAAERSADLRTLPLWSGSEPNDPRFCRWTGDGAVSEQLTTPASVRELLDGRLSTVRVTAREFLVRRRADSRSARTKQRVELWLRVSSEGERRSPVWARFPMVMHRPLPPDAQIQRVTVHRHMIGPRPEWYATFTVRVPEPAPKAGKAVALDVGWRQRKDSLRVAFACDEDGRTQELIMPVEVLTGIDVPNGIRAVRDKLFDAARARLVDWIGQHADIPDWFREATASISQWRSQARLAALVLRWRENRFAGDAEAFDQLDGPPIGGKWKAMRPEDFDRLPWRQRDKHLWLYETSQRTGSLRRRREWFRVVAARLADQYATLVLEDFDLRQLARRQDVAAAERDNETARRNRTLAAIGEFRTVLRNAFRRRGGSVVTVPAENTTRTCSVCGVVEEFDAATMLRHGCANGHEWDQDENAARNLIERWRGGQDPGTARSPEPPKESRHERRRRMTRAKREREGLSKGGDDGAMASEVV